MNRLRRLSRIITMAGLAAALGAAAAPMAGADTSETFSVVADHLGNPRMLSPAPDGGVYLAEAGSGGDVCLPSGEMCFGLTGSLDLVGANGGVNRIVTGLISAAAPGGVSAGGAGAVARGPDGQFFGQFEASSHEFVPPEGVIPDNLRDAALAEFGHLWLVRSNGATRDLSDVGDQDWTWTSTHVDLAPKDFPDANPNDVLYSGGDVYVVDAAANTLVGVDRDGGAKVLTFFPVPAGAQSDSVPTCVARGPDGALYVGELLGGYYAAGYARVWRVVPGHAPKVWATGLTAVQGCGFGHDGAFYATEFEAGGFTSGNPAGDVVRIDRNGNRTHLGVGKLFLPSGFAAGPDGSIYVSNCSIAPATGMGPYLCPTGGQLVRIG